MRTNLQSNAALASQGWEWVENCTTLSAATGLILQYKLTDNQYDWCVGGPKIGDSLPVIRMAQTGVYRRSGRRVATAVPGGGVAPVREPEPTTALAA